MKRVMCRNAVLAQVLLLLFICNVYAGNVGTEDLLDAAVTTEKLADGAVTDAKISGQIAGSKISSTGLDADTLDGFQAADFADVAHSHSLAKQAIVATSGGDYSDPVIAMNDIVTWCGTPSATNPCVLKIMPGTYDIGSSALYMQEYVDIEGSGQSTTTIQGSYGYNSVGVVNGANNSELRDLSVVHYGAGAEIAVAIKAYYLDSTFRITNVSAEAYGVANNIAVYFFGASPIVTHLTASAHGTYSNTAIWNSYASPDISDARLKAFSGTHGNVGVENNYVSEINLSNVIIDVADGTNHGIENERSTGINISDTTISAPGGRGIYNIASSVTLNEIKVLNSDTAVKSQTYGGYENKLSIHRSNLKGNLSSVESNVETNIALSQLDGPLNYTGPYTCFNNYDGTFGAVTCP